MKYVGIFMIVLSLLLFSSCTNVENVEDIQNVPTADEIKSDSVEISDIAEAQEPVVVAPIAKEDFFQPFDDYSWELTEKAEYVVLHFTSAVVLTKDEPYNLTKIREIFEDSSISIHYIIDRDGTVYCWLPETRAAWHAGKGTFADNEKYTNSMNKYSIGIEMLAIGSKNDMTQYLTSAEYDALDKSLLGFTEKQYESLGTLVRDICKRNEIPFDRDHVIGHDMYNPSKNDPGELFDWEKLFSKR